MAPSVGFQALYEVFVGRAWVHRHGKIPGTVTPHASWARLRICKVRPQLINDLRNGIGLACSGDALEQEVLLAQKRLSKCAVVRFVSHVHSDFMLGI
jgi:hypothetical protein